MQIGPLRPRRLDTGALADHPGLRASESFARINRIGFTVLLQTGTVEKPNKRSFDSPTIERSHLAVTGISFTRVRHQ